MSERQWEPQVGGWEPPVVDTSVQVGAIDSAPSTGVFADWRGVDITPAEAAEGNRLGEQIDIDNDYDNGGVR